MQAHLVQLDIVWENPEANYDRVADLVVAADVTASDLVILPEMFDTGFSFNLDRTADREGKTLRFLQTFAKNRSIFLQGSRTVIGSDGRGRNRATIVDPSGKVICEYDKVHPFSFGKETQFFSGGSDIATYCWQTTSAESTIVCPAICYDLRFPELFRLGMLKGAEVIALGANWPASRQQHREVLSVARAIENQSYVFCVNRAGDDPHLSYQGNSLAVGPEGEVIGRLGAEEGVLSVDVDLAGLREWRRNFPATRDVRMIHV